MPGAAFERIAPYVGTKPCGTRSRYTLGCRCDECRRANTDYEKHRAHARANGDWNGLVPAAKVRAHVRKLARQGVGTRIVSECSGVSRSALNGIMAGKRYFIRARNEKKILAVTTAMRGDKTLISAAGTWKLIDALLAEGFTRQYLARELGYTGRGLQLGRERITVRNAARVAALHRRLTT